MLYINDDYSITNFIDREECARADELERLKVLKQIDKIRQYEECYNGEEYEE